MRRTHPTLAIVVQKSSKPLSFGLKLIWMTIRADMIKKEEIKMGLISRSTKHIVTFIEILFFEKIGFL
ncbi:hypothetical protein PN36_22820 [Candidatus Thiomargarita nelsonii]|uniref:Uncharacterized protein n=1 Tax=Candidatus Thiomargarita nelsonii TaxID=1003181 RepID=A0A4E0QP43_9GAMM|nr:hypothetical protein PN36_22820 [Candidatus Thiomargarita nelsonii]